MPARDAEPTGDDGAGPGRLLARHPFFAGLAAATLEPLAGCAVTVRFDAGAYLCREGEPANRFYLLGGGMASIEIAAPSRGRRSLQTVSAGEVVGWSWLIAPHRWHFDVRAVEPVWAIGLDGACLRAAFSDHHELGYHVLSRLSGVMAKRLEATRLQLMDVYGARD